MRYLALLPVAFDAVIFAVSVGLSLYAWLRYRNVDWDQLEREWLATWKVVVGG